MVDIRSDTPSDGLSIIWWRISEIKYIYWFRVEPYTQQVEGLSGPGYVIQFPKSLALRQE